MNKLLDSKEAESIISGLNIMGSLCGFGQSFEFQRPKSDVEVQGIASVENLKNKDTENIENPITKLQEVTEFAYIENQDFFRRNSHSKTLLPNLTP